MKFKEIAEDFIIMCANGKSREAFNLYVDKEFKHHNPYFEGDAESLMNAMEEDAKLNPDKIFEVKQILHDGNLVAIHSFLKQNADSPEMAVVHILKFREEKIIELWDLVQSVPEDMKNENGLF